MVGSILHAIAYDIDYVDVKAYHMTMQYAFWSCGMFFVTMWYVLSQP